ncbi:NAD(P)H-binding protein [Pasteurellaceae bacterium TAE3-ERU1]|nr:NAD(P)H-binding protein [Pasteurellaceae bacterium TAE3-ERU1]
MMKIAILVANGKAGRAILQEAVNRGHDVCAFSRQPITLENITFAHQQRDIFDLTTDDFKPFDVVIDAFGVFQSELLDGHTTHLVHLAQQLSGVETQLAVVGGAGSLYLDEQHQTQLKDSPTFPAEFAPLATAQGAGLTRLRTFSAVNWLYLSPAADFQADGERTGQYQLAGERFTVNDKQQSTISYADYAIAMLDLVEQKRYVRQRLSVLAP